MWLFKSKEQREKEDCLDARFKELDRFPGTLAEYDTFRVIEHRIMDTGNNQNFVSEGKCDRELQRWLINRGCVGLIHYVPYQRSNNSYRAVEVGGYGVPVKRKEKISS